MESLGIREADIEEKFICSSGKGGQNINKTATCVYLKHIPTGIEVKCMRDRSQSVNRFLARLEFVERFEELLNIKTGENIKKKSTGSRRQKEKRRQGKNTMDNW
ncbi:hypothetical protein JZK55_00270 [Dissulfurispira thermophila]|uniref:Prokaryotic-type class I peptide chain release factors domain-containing protein n=2 Tax=root TaxID=1 RepID=A0A7G1GXQ7_9BACT|nr:peptide chain release factor-like protein [Dissulfurispira thermophila]BCB95105.1 hypothetical protein JZK55_00270 [Dissulfurispira thermophila]